MFEYNSTKMETIDSLKGFHVEEGEVGQQSMASSSDGLVKFKV